MLDNPNQPLLNRATMGLYPLGSVFKVITMSAALESGLYTPNSTYTCTGYYTVPGFSGTDWTVEHDVKPHGKITLVQGLTRSCDCFFWQVGYDLYYKDAWLVPNMARAYGLGKPTGIGVIPEEAGFVPDPGWKHDTQGEDWTTGDALNQAIGQGKLQVTPLQVVDYMAAVGNGGTLYRPQLILKIQPPIGDPVFTFHPEVRGILPVSADNLAAIQQGLIGVVNDPNGTARAHYYGITDIYNIAGKTGTASNGTNYPHAWFAGYTFEDAPNKPDIAAAVVVESSGEGSTYASPMVRRIIEIYFQGAPAAFYPWESTYGTVGTSTPEYTDTPEETPSP